MSGQNLARGQEKFITPLAGYTKDESCDDLQYQTGQNVNGQKRAADTVVYGTYAVSTGNSIANGSTQRKIVKVAHGARKNDVIQFTSGNSAGIAIQILSCPDSDTMILAATPEFALAVGDTFDIKRYVSPQYASDGSLSVTVTPSATEATAANQVLQLAEETAIHTSVGDKADAAASTDTGTFSIISLIKRSLQNWTTLQAKIPALVGGKIPVVTLDQVQTGTFVEDLTVSTTPEAFTPPAGAFAALVEVPDSNGVNVRVVMDASVDASTTSGIVFQPGRSELYQGGTRISYCSESTSGQQISVQWFIKT